MTNYKKESKIDHSFSCSIFSWLVEVLLFIMSTLVILCRWERRIDCTFWSRLGCGKLSFIGIFESRRRKLIRKTILWQRYLVNVDSFFWTNCHPSNNCLLLLQFIQPLGFLFLTKDTFTSTFLWDHIWFSQRMSEPPRMQIPLLPWDMTKLIWPFLRVRCKRWWYSLPDYRMTLWEIWNSTVQPEYYLTYSIPNLHVVIISFFLYDFGVELDADSDGVDLIEDSFDIPDG